MVNFLYLKIRTSSNVHVGVLDRTVAWSRVSMRMCPPQCVTCKSVRLDEFDGFVGERECSGPRLFDHL